MPEFDKVAAILDGVRLVRAVNPVDDEPAMAVRKNHLEFNEQLGFLAMKQAVVHDDDQYHLLAFGLPEFSGYSARSILARTVSWDEEKELAAAKTGEAGLRLVNAPWYVRNSGLVVAYSFSLPKAHQAIDDRSHTQPLDKWEKGKRLEILAEEGKQLFSVLGRSALDRIPSLKTPPIDDATFKEYAAVIRDVSLAEALGYQLDRYTRQAAIRPLELVTRATLYRKGTYPHFSKATSTGSAR